MHLNVNDQQIFSWVWYWYWDEYTHINPYYCHYRISRSPCQIKNWNQYKLIIWTWKLKFCRLHYIFFFGYRIDDFLSSLCPYPPKQLEFRSMAQYRHIIFLFTFIFFTESLGIVKSFALSSTSYPSTFKFSARFALVDTNVLTLVSK